MIHSNYWLFHHPLLCVFSTDSSLSLAPILCESLLQCPALSSGDNSYQLCTNLSVIWVLRWCHRVEHQHSLRKHREMSPSWTVFCPTGNDPSSLIPRAAGQGKAKGLTLPGLLWKSGKNGQRRKVLPASCACRSSRISFLMEKSDPTTPETGISIKFLWLTHKILQNKHNFICCQSTQLLQDLCLDADFGVVNSHYFQMCPKILTVKETWDPRVLTAGRNIFFIMLG